MIPRNRSSSCNLSKRNVKVVFCRQREQVLYFIIILIISLDYFQNKI